MKDIKTLISEFAANNDISEFSTGVEQIIQSRVDALAESTRQDALQGVGFVVKEATTTDDADADKSKDEEKKDDKEDESEGKDKDDKDKKDSESKSDADDEKKDKDSKDKDGLEESFNKSIS